MTKTLSLAIGIITYKRRKQTLKLLRELVKQLQKEDKIFVVENGSTEINKDELNLISKKQIELIYLKDRSIPVSRNKVFQIANGSYDILAYIDSDCLPHPNWLSEIKSEFSYEKNYPIIQGAIVSRPQNNIYAQTSQLLFDLWQEKNTVNNITKILDTKNIFFKLAPLKKIRTLFDEKLTYASDIDLGYKLQKKGYKIKKTNKALVYHYERKTFFSFIKHRTRISQSYRKVTHRYPDFFRSAHPLEKIVYLLKKLHFPLYKKIEIIFFLQLIYVYSLLNIKIKKIEI